MNLEIRIVDEADNEEIQKFYPEETEGHIRVGDKGYLFPMRYRDGLHKVYNFQVKKNDIYVATYPRSGTTWTQELVWLIANDFDFETAKRISLRQRYPVLEFFMYMRRSTIDKLSANFANDKDKLNMLNAISTFPGDYLATVKSTRFIKTHMPLSLLPPNLLNTAKMVYVARDPRDVAVSFFYICRVLFKLNPIVDDFKLCWNLFIKDLVLWSPIFEHIKEAWRLRHHPNMLFLFYEELAQDLPGVVSRVSEFLGKQYTADQMEAICDHLNFDKFKQNPAVQLAEFKEMGLLSEPENFIRKGKVGGWQDYFDDEMKQQAEEWMTRNLEKTDLIFPTFSVKSKGA